MITGAIVLALLKLSLSPFGGSNPWFIGAFAALLLIFSKYRHPILVALLCFFISENLLPSNNPSSQLYRGNLRILTPPYQTQYETRAIVQTEKGKALLRMPTHAFPFHAGQKLEVSALWEPPETRYHQQLPRLKIKSLKLVKPIGKPSLFFLPQRLNEKIYQHLQFFQKDYPQAVAILSALILGRVNEVDPDARLSLARGGISHLLAISGLHVGIWLLLLMGCLAFFDAPPHRTVTLLLFFLLFYTAFCGFRPAVVRASLMAGFYLWGRLSGWVISPGEALGLSFLVSTALMPLTFGSIGFWLTYGATFIILALSQIHPRVAFWGTSFFILPMQGYFFGFLSPLGLILSPLLGLMLLFFMPIFALITLFPSPLSLSFVEGLFNKALGILAHTPAFPWISLKGALFLFILSLMLASLKQKKVISGVLLLGVLLLSPYWGKLPRPKGVGIDVGEGLAFLLTGPQPALIDTGKLPMHRALIPALTRERVVALSALFLTHPDLDHMGEAVRLIQLYPVGRIFAPACCIPAFQAIGFPLPLTPLYPEQKVNLPPWSIQVLWPPNPCPFYHDNDCSLVLHIQGPVEVLITGDISKRVEPQLPYPERVDILQIPHHGSKTSTSWRLLTCWKPRIAFIPVGLHNPYHHPNRKVLQRLQKATVLMKRTDLHGTVFFYRDPQGNLRTHTTW